MKITQARFFVCILIGVTANIICMDKPVKKYNRKKYIEIPLKEGNFFLERWKITQSRSLYTHCLTHNQDYQTVDLIPCFPHVSLEKFQLFSKALDVKPGNIFKKYIESLSVEKKHLLITAAGEYNDEGRVQLNAPLLTAQLMDTYLPPDVCAIVRRLIGGELAIENHFINQMVIRATKSSYKESKKESTRLLLEDAYQIAKPIPIGYDVKSKIVFSRDRRYAAAYSDERIVLSAVEEKKSVELSQGILLKHVGTVQGACFNAQSTLLLSWASKSFNLDVKMWDMLGKCLATFDFGPKAKVGQAMFNDEGNRLLIRVEHINFAFSSENDLFVYEVADVSNIRVVHGICNGNFHDAVYSALGDTWMIPQKNRSILFIRNVIDGCIENTYSNELHTNVNGGKVFHLSSPDGRFFIAVMPQISGYVARIWNAVTGELITKIQCPRSIQCASNVQKLIVTPDNKKLFYKTDFCYEYHETGRTFHKCSYYEQPLCCSKGIPILESLINSMTFAELFIFRRLLCAYQSGETVVEFYEQEPAYKILSMMCNKKDIGKLIKKYIHYSCKKI